jgi:alpha-tubulin suppressor-like RCC1 family protein
MGRNDVGQLGISILNHSLVNFLNINFTSKVNDISCGNNFNILLDFSNNVFGFGSNSLGQLGLNSIQIVDTPTFIMSNIIKITTGEFNTLLLHKNNNIYTFGSNSNGQLGLGLPTSNII